MSNKNLLISVIVPVYNIVEYLPRCLDSILNQTYSNLEVIVISDGSTDGTDNVIKEYAEKDSRVVPVFKENSGVSDTRNKGLDIAKGDYIGFVDGDDYIEPNMYEILLNNAVENDADISHCGYQRVFPTRVDYYYNTGKKVIQDNKKGIRDIIVGDYVEPGIWNKLYRKSTIENVFMPADIKINEDVLFNFYAFSIARKSIYFDMPLYNYVLRDGSASQSKVNRNILFDPVIVSKIIFNECSEKFNTLKGFSYQRYFYCVVGMFRSVYRNKLSDFLDEAYEYKKELLDVTVNFQIKRRLKIEKFLFNHCNKLYFLVYRFYDKFRYNR